MKLSKIIFAGLTTLSISTVSFLAHAGDLHLMNNTDFDSTSYINGFACSDMLGESGITRAHQPNTIGDSLVRVACMFNSSDCVADVYMTPDCSGEKVATVTFSVDDGIKNITMLSNKYSIVKNGPFDVAMNPVG